MPRNDPAYSHRFAFCYDSLLAMIVHIQVLNFLIPESLHLPNVWSSAEEPIYSCLGSENCKKEAKLKKLIC